jgi:Tol biopolymer transport system component
MNESMDHVLADWLRDGPESGPSEGLERALAATRHVDQRPGWTFPERWLPMQLTMARTRSLRPLLAIVMIALLIVAMVAAALLIGSTRRPLPPPFGPAANGALVYAEDGDIYALDPATGTSSAIVAGPTDEAGPLFSRDGSMFLFTRETETPNLWRLMVANADGTSVRSLGEPFELDPGWGVAGSLDGWVSWSPDGTRTAGIDVSGQSSLVIGNIDGSPPQVLDLGLRPESISWRPNGQELVFRGSTLGPGAETLGLYTVRADGTGLRAILPPTFSGEHWQKPALSPDGTQIIYTQWDGDAYPGGHLYVVDVDSGDVRRLVFDGSIESDYFAEWSPDGSQIVFNRGRAQDKYYLAVGPAIGGDAVNIGPEQPWADAATAAFSPDGSKVIARYSNGETWIFDVAGGPGERLRIDPPNQMSWQRLAP